MKRANLFFSIAFGMANFVFQSAFAAESMTVRSGVTSEVGYFSLYDPRTCGHGPKPGMILLQPQHGSLVAKWTKSTVARGLCKGNIARGYVVYYKSNSGYRGTDVGAYTVNYPEYVNGPLDRSKVYTLNLTVK